MKRKRTTAIHWAPSMMAVLLSLTNTLPLMARNIPEPAPISLADAAPPSGAQSGGREAVSPYPPDEIVPDSDARHETNKTLSMSQLRLHSTVTVHSLRAVQQEVGFDQPISLEEALKYAVQNNLAIKVSRESKNYQRYVLCGNIASTLPSFSLAYNITRSNIYSEGVNSLARVQLERVSFPVFQGGSVMYGLLAQAFRARGWTHAYQASMNDMLLQIYQNYNNLQLARVLMLIRAKAVQVDEEQLRVNQQLETNGVGTRFAVMQSDAQLAADRQALIQQQVAVRQAALGLNYVLNYPMSVNLIPMEDSITEQSLFETGSKITDIVRAAVNRRPELREYELFKFGAARNIQVAAAPLYPQLNFYTAVSYTNTTSTSKTNSKRSTSTADTAGAGVFGGVFRTVTTGMGLTWSLNGMGLVNVANLFGAQSFNRQAGIQANQQLQNVFQQVRSDYLTWRAAREQIDNAAHGVESSAEELRLASIRLREGVGTNLELIQAQRDYINALSTQAQAIVGSNLAQAQLLHDTGLISTNTLLHGYRGEIN
jgi:outer membrane protein TolC